MDIAKKIKPILISENVLKTAIFGSFARGDYNKNSDLDLLVKFNKNATLLDLARLQRLISKSINRQVDIITYNGIYPPLKKYILGQEKVIYEKR